MAIKIVIANDQHLHRNATAIRLKMRSDFEICAQVANGIEALRAVRLFNPDILLLDLRMPEMDGFNVLKTLQEEKSSVKTIVVSMMDNSQNVVYCMQLGAVGFLSTFNETDNEETAIDSVMANGFYFNSQTDLSLLKEIIKSKKINPRFSEAKIDFSEDEIKFLDAYCTKYHSEQVADEICFSVSKVEKIKHNLIEKLNVQNFISVILYAHQNRFIDLDQIPVQYNNSLAKQKVESV